jgi:hypothetical protein
MAFELRGSLRSRAKPIAGYWREARTQNGSKSDASTRVGRPSKLDRPSQAARPNKHLPSLQIEGRSGEISGLGLEVEPERVILAGEQCTR